MEIIRKRESSTGYLRSITLIALFTLATTTPQNQYWEIIRPVGSPTGESYQIIQESPVPVVGPYAVQPYSQVFEGPRKRSAIVIDKLMYALQRAIDGKEKQQAKMEGFGSIPELQRRGTGDTRLYWRCYFNAVSCF